MKCKIATMQDVGLDYKFEAHAETREEISKKTIGHAQIVRKAKEIPK